MSRSSVASLFLGVLLSGSASHAEDCGDTVCISTTDDGSSSGDSSDSWGDPPAPGDSFALPPSVSPGGNVAKRMCGELDVDIDENFDEPLEDLPEVTALSEAEASASGTEIGASADRDFSTNVVTNASTMAQQAGAVGAATLVPSLAPSPKVVPSFASENDALVPGAMGLGVDDGARTEEETGSDPVDPGTSEFLLHRQDLFLPGVGLDVSFTRTYRSRWTYDGPLGYGWTHTYDQRLISALGACNLAVVTWSTGTGSVLRFAQQSDGTYRPVPEAPYSLTPLGSGWRLVAPDGRTSSFDADGVLVSIADLNDNRIVLEWEASPRGDGKRLKKITDTVGRVIELAYGVDGYLDGISFPAASIVIEYEIDTAGDLVLVQSAEGVQEHYTYSSGYPDTQTSVPTPLLAAFCAEQCGTEGTLCSQSAACATAQQNAMTQCTSQCMPPDGGAACRAGCPAACVTACNQNSASCNSDCADGCAAACSSADQRACDKFWDETGKARCNSGCVDYCTAVCGESCSTYLAVAVGDDGDLEGLSPDILECGGTLVLGLIGAALCVGELGIDGLACAACGWWGGCECEVSCDSGVQEQIDDWLETGGLRCCNMGCNECCRQGSNCQSGSCQAGRECRPDCEAAFFHGPDAGIYAQCSNPFDGDWGATQGCLGQAYDRCREECDLTGCQTRCAIACPGSCETACTAACSDPAGCLEHCGQVDYSQVCGESCESACKTANAATGGLAFGRSGDLNHNILTIADGGGLVFLINEYGNDITHPAFDRITHQIFGPASIEYAQYDLVTPGAPAIAADHQSYIETNPQRTAICPTRLSLCEGPGAGTSPRATIPGARPEMWVRVRDGYYLVLDSPGGAPLGGFRVTGPEPSGLSWLELSRAPSGEITTNPPLPLKSRISFGGNGAEFSIEPIPGFAGRVRIQASAAADTGKAAQKRPPFSPDALFKAADGTSVPVSLFATDEGWRLSPGRVVAAVEVREPRACQDVFRVNTTDSGTHLEPPDACRSSFHTRVLGRRWRASAAVESSSRSALAPDWQSLLAEPNSTVEVRVRKGGLLIGGARERDVPRSPRSALDRLFGGTGGTMTRGLGGWIDPQSARDCWPAPPIDPPMPGGSPLPPLPDPPDPLLPWIGTSGPNGPGLGGGLGFPGLDHGPSGGALGLGGLKPDSPGGLLLSARDPGRPSVPNLGGLVGFTPNPESPRAPPLDCWLPPPWEPPRLPQGPLLCFEYTDSVPIDRATDDTPIARVTLVKDAAGAVWTHYVDALGRVVRVVNHASGETRERNYDDKGRLVGETTAFGDRTCRSYDRNWNLVADTHLPSKTRWAPAPKITKQYQWESYARLKTHSVDGLMRFQQYWDTAGNLKRIKYPSAGEVNFTRDERGRAIRVVSPDATATDIKYDDASGQWETVVFDATAADPLGATAEWDDLGRIRKFTRDGEGTVEFTRDADERILTRSVLLDATLQPVTYTYTYDGAGELASISGPRATRNYARDARGLVTLLKDTADEGVGFERNTCFRYDGRGDVVEIVKPEGNRIRFARGLDGRVTSIERGVWTDSSAWDDGCEAQAPRSSVAVQETFEQFTWFPGGLLSRRKNGAYQAVAFEYDGYGRLLEQRYADKSRERFEYDALGRLISDARYAAGAPDLPPSSGSATPRVSDPYLVGASLFRYDVRDRLTQQDALWFYDGTDGVRHSLGTGHAIRSTTYFDSQRRVRIREPDGLVKDLFFDGLHRLVQVKANDVLALTLQYADRGRDISVTMPAPVPDGALKRRILRTDFGSLKRVEGATGLAVRTLDYYDDGSVKLSASPTGVFETTYSPFGELANVSRLTDAGVAEPFFSTSNDRNGDVTATVDGLDHSTTYQRDHADRVATTTYADGTQASDTYVNGSYATASHLDRNGGHVSYSYDAFGALKLATADNVGSSAAWSGSTSIRFMRTIGGLKRAEHSGQPGTTVDDFATDFVRDSLGALVLETHANPALDITYARMPSGKVTTVTAAGESIKYTYEPWGRLDTVETSGSLVADYDYSGVGEPTKITFGNGVVDLLSYDAEGRPLQTRTEGPGGAVLRKTDLFWRADGLLGRTDRVGSATTPRTGVYGVDGLRRLASETRGLEGVATMTSGQIQAADLAPLIGTSADWTQYIYDRADNWRSLTSAGGAAISPTIGADNRYTDFGGSLQSDAEGNASQLPNGDKFFFNGFGELVKLEHGGSAIGFRYDPFGQLVAWGISGDEVTVARADGAPFRETHGTATKLICAASNTLIGQVQDGQTEYFHHGWDRRTELATGSDGAVAERYTYGAYGDVRITDATGGVRTESAISNHYLIAGGPYLASVALHQFGARWYSPAIGRFISPDPLGFIDGPNRYAFAGNQPLAYFDPTGLWKRQLANGLEHSVEGLADFGIGFLDALLVPPGGRPVGIWFGNDAEYAVGNILGSGLGLLGDTWLIVGGGTLAAGGGAAEFVTVGVASPIALPAVGVGVVAAGAGIAGVATHGGRLVEGFKNLDRAFSESRSNGEPQLPRTDTPTTNGSNGAWTPPAGATDKMPSTWGPGSPTKKGVGTRWQDPTNPGNGVRIDQGNPASAQATQQVDHVIVRYNGEVLGRSGTPIPGSIAENAVEAHIPLSEWLGWSTWFHP
jgi:RHS repeat-associated protein